MLIYRKHFHCGTLLQCQWLVCSWCLSDFVVSKFFSPMQDLCNIWDFGCFSHTFSNLVWAICISFQACAHMKSPFDRWTTSRALGRQYESNLTPVWLYCSCVILLCAVPWVLGRQKAPSLTAAGEQTTWPGNLDYSCSAWAQSSSAPKHDNM